MWWLCFREAILATMSMTLANETVTVSWFPVVTLILGFIISAITDWNKDKRDRNRESEARREARRDLLAEHRRTFQRETVLALQESVQDLARGVGAAQHHDEMAYRQTGKWQAVELAEEVDKQIFDANRRTMVLAVRVRDQALRDLLSNFRELAGHVQLALPTGSDAERRVAATATCREMVSKVPLIHHRIGEILHNLDDEEN